MWGKRYQRNGMEIMIGAYFSGTGNTKHCVEQFVAQCDNNSTAVSIETPGLNEALAGHNMIIYGYMQSIGMVNDHTTDCFVFQQISQK